MIDAIGPDSGLSNPSWAAREGMRTMRGRAANAGPTLHVASVPVAGTRVTIEAPMPR